MLEYKFIRCKVVFDTYGHIDPASYETLIDEYVSQGWQSKQIFIENPATIPTEYVVIFERKN